METIAFHGGPLQGDVRKLVMPPQLDGGVCHSLLIPVILEGEEDSRLTEYTRVHNSLGQDTHDFEFVGYHKEMS